MKKPTKNQLLKKKMSQVQTLFTLNGRPLMQLEPSETRDKLLAVNLRYELAARNAFKAKDMDEIDKSISTLEKLKAHIAGLDIRVRHRKPQYVTYIVEEAA